MALFHGSVYKTGAGIPNSNDRAGDFGDCYYYDMGVKMEGEKC